VHTVINYEMPRSRDTYIHRVGRTARAGCGGRSVTLIGEVRRIVMKEILKTQHDSAEIKSRAVPQSVIDHFRYYYYTPHANSDKPTVIYFLLACTSSVSRITHK
jgi:superfamily II DNA/RNA helicase